MRYIPSRFIAEIKRELFVTEGEMDEALWKRLQDQIQSENLGELSTARASIVHRHSQW